jgi:putative peptide zinc metalloprotease protein
VGTVTQKTSASHKARRLLVLVAVLLPLLVQSAAATETAAGGGADHVVLAFNQTDGALRAASGVAVSITAANAVGTENLAFARSTCSDCRTVAVAFQAVPIIRDVDVIAPANAAVAVNADCTSCQTAAFAYQYVLTTGGAVHLSPAGQSEVSTIRAEARELAASDLSFPALEEQLDALAARFKSVIDEELVGAGPGALAKRVDRAGVTP